MGRIANILDVPLDQKALIVSAFISIEFLLPFALQQGETEESVLEKTLEFVKEQLGPEISEAKIDLLLKKHLDSYDFSL